MAVVSTSHVELDREGVAWIAGANTKVIEVVLDKIAYGWSPEEIHLQHPHLSLAQIHSALAYYYENQKALDEEIERRREEGEKLSRQRSNVELRRRLIGRKNRP